MMTRFVLRTATLAATVALTGGAHAALTAYSSQAGFLAVIFNPGVDTFDGLSTTASTPGPLNRAAGGYTYKAQALKDTSAGDFFGAGTSANPWLSTNQADFSIVFSAFSGGASGVGANFFGSDVDGLFSLGDITLVAVDSLGATSTQSIVGATTSSFMGFKSTGTIVSLTLSAVQPAGGFTWPTVDNMTLGVSAVPEPGTYALMLAGLAAVGGICRGRRCSRS